jgi:hypothetical protein
LLTNSAPSPSALRAVHGTGNMLNSLSREVGPAIGGLVFGWGLDIEMIGLVWWCYLTVFAVLELMWSWLLKDKGNTSTKNVSQVAVELLAAPGCAPSLEDICEEEY